ncbi:hypothetical protein [Galactobacillus timonensis]|uniref:hypothetical protein n=1 Tax=Galactobacillus timonensis TaxID=2041840 RepID=UPI0023F47984|nr:hypothetical protein [Galactobacillus timonensis]MCI6754274.1 hypothetical protein [Galactobacillus timonensis]
MAKNKSLTFSSSALEKWSHSCGLAFTLTLSNAALVLPDGRMVAGTYAGYPQSHVSPSVIRYLFQPCYGAAEMPDAIRITVLNIPMWRSRVSGETKATFSKTDLM